MATIHDQHETMNAAWKLYKKFYRIETPEGWQHLHDEFEAFLTARPGDLFADALAEAFIKDIARRSTS